MDLQLHKRKELVVLCEDLGVQVTKSETKPLLVEAILALGIQQNELEERWEEIQEEENDKWEKERQHELKKLKKGAPI